MQRIPVSPLAYAGIPLLLCALVSGFFVPLPWVWTAWWGTGYELSTVGSVVFLVVACLVGAFASRTEALVSEWAYLLFCAVLSAVALWERFTPSIFSEIPVGLWVQLSFLLCAAALASAVLCDRARESRLRALYGAAAVLFLAGFAALFQPVAAGVGIVVVLVLILFSFKSEGGVAASAFPLATATCGVILAGLISFGLPSPLLSGAGTDTPPFVSVTELVVAPEYIDSLKSALVGSGPATFARIWNEYRPVEENRTSAWNDDPIEAFSTAGTVAIEFGSLGFLAFLLIPLALVIAMFTRSFRADGSGALEASAALALFVFGAAVAFPVGLPVILVGALALGFCARFFSELDDSARLHFGLVTRAGIGLALLAVCVGLAYVGSRQAIAAYEHTQGITIAQSDVTTAAPILLQAAHMWETPSYDRDAALAIAQSAFIVASAESQGGNPDKNAFTTRVGQAMGLAARAEAINRYDYTSWLFEGSLFASLIDAGVPDAAKLAQQSLQQAAGEAPTDPEIPYLEASLAIKGGDIVSARTYLQKALELKPDYGDAQKALQSLGQ